jgi:phosphoheptose isomerase
MTNINDHHFLKNYFQLLRQATDLSEEYEQKLIQVKDLWLETKKADGKIIFVGNGGSAGIASHLAIDLSKNGRIRAVCFNDASLITCLSNDYGYEHWLSSAIKMYADKGDVLVAISSSGCSPNILMGVKEAKRKNMGIVTLSGFESNNHLS